MIQKIQKMHGKPVNKHKEMVKGSAKFNSKRDANKAAGEKLHRMATQSKNLDK